MRHISIDEKGLTKVKFFTKWNSVKRVDTSLSTGKCLLFCMCVGFVCRQVGLMKIL